jgi:hypothetical protein
VIEKGANKHCVKPKPDIGQVRWTKELKIEQRQKENAHSVCVCVISQSFSDCRLEFVQKSMVT